VRLVVARQHKPLENDLSTIAARRQRPLFVHFTRKNIDVVLDHAVSGNRNSVVASSYTSLMNPTTNIVHRPVIHCIQLNLTFTQFIIARPQSIRNSCITRAQQLPRWAAVPQLSGPKSGGCCAPFRVGAGSPSNTMRPGPRPTSVPSDISIHPTVWPQYTNVTDRTDRQTDNGPVA